MDYLSNLFSTISGSPFLMIVLILGLIIIGYAVVKKIFKLAIFAIACIIIYLIYIAIMYGAENVIDKTIEDYGNTKDTLNKFVDDANEFVNEKFSKSLDDSDNSSSVKEKKP